MNWKRWKMTSKHFISVDHQTIYYVKSLGSYVSLTEIGNQLLRRIMIHSVQWNIIFQPPPSRRSVAYES